ncbi:PEP-CTERM protein-sorting domain-containing protein [Prosthecobacter debontii]|uniref:PEP-CTERM protein-sorting domain-containing protein n=2 Tax=Prosthecobacter debontii TaxID=48467 RepID=A0A1T4YXJ1_9BACT|nr:PEP-CTERM protein-sorting domain-containing protein [Prosthecobacter debontii]
MLVAMILVMMMAVQSLSAANGTWSGTVTGTTAWNDLNNWQGSAIAGNNAGTLNSDLATFGTTTAVTLITIDANRIIGSMLFNGSDTAGVYTIGSAGANLGEALRLSNGGNITVGSTAKTVTTIDAPLILMPASTTTAGVYTLTNNSADVDGDPNNYKLNVTGNISGGDTNSTITLNLTGSAGSRSVNTSGNTISGLISNGGALGGLSISLTGADGGDRGAWTLTNDSNSFTGNVTVNNGTLYFTSIADAGQNSAIGAGNTLTMQNGAQVKYAGPAASTNRTITGSGSLYSQGTGALTLTGTFLPVGTITFRGSQNFIIESVIGGTGSLNRTDPGTVYLNNVNSFSGNVSAQDGAFRFASIADKGIASGIGAGTTITLGQNSNTVGRIEFTGANGGSSNRDIRLQNGNGASSGNGRIDNTVAGQTLTLSGTVRSTSTDATHVSSLNLTGVGNGIMSGIIGGTNANASATIAMQLTKTGTGTWALAAANNYSRGTLISAGTLLATNTTGSATGTGNVITSGTGTLGGTGIVSGGSGASITIASGTKLMVGNTHLTASGDVGTAGYTGAASQLRLGSATDVAITLAGTLQFDLFGAGSSDRLVLATTASTITLGGQISVANVSNQGRPAWTAGSWQILDWTGAASATQSGVFTFDFANAPLASGYSWVTTDVYSTGNISIVKTANNHTWLGGASSSWADAANWEASTVPTSSTDVFFLNSTANLTSAINGDKSVKNLFFSGEQNYTINTGSGGVLYSHGNTLEVLGGVQNFGVQLRPSSPNVANYYIINQGTLNLTQPVMWHRQGTGTVYNMNLVFEGSGNTSVNYFTRRANTYDLNIVKNGTGTLTVTFGTLTEALENAAGSITGTTTVNAGKLRLNNEWNLGTNPAAFNGAHLTLNGGTVSAYATFTMDDANRGITIGANGGTLEVEGTNTWTVANAVTGSGNLTKTGTGTLAFTGANNTHAGTFEINAGTVQISSGAFSGTGATTVTYGAQLVGTGTVQANSFSLVEGAGLQAGNITSGTATGNGTLTFTPASGVGHYDFQTNSGILLSITSATNQSALDSTFGGNILGSAGYNAYVDAISGAGNHDQLVFNGGTGSTLDFSGRITVESASFTPVAGQVFNLLDWSSLIAADFSSFNVGTLRNGADDDASQFNLPNISGSGLYWDVSRFTTSGALVIVAVPEPSRALLLGGSLGLLMLRRRRRC